MVNLYGGTWLWKAGLQLWNEWEIENNDIPASQVVKQLKRYSGGHKPLFSLSPFLAAHGPMDLFHDHWLIAGLILQKTLDGLWQALGFNWRLVKQSSAGHWGCWDAKKALSHHGPCAWHRSDPTFRDLHPEIDCILQVGKCLEQGGTFCPLVSPCAGTVICKWVFILLKQFSNSRR